MTIRRKDSAPNLPRKLTPTEVRAKVVEEILNTERDYVRNLENIVEVSMYMYIHVHVLYGGYFWGGEGQRKLSNNLIS